MKEFSDEFLKDLVNQKADEFETQDNLHLEWKNISKKLPRNEVTIPYYTVAALTGVIILLLVVYKKHFIENVSSSLKMTSSSALVSEQPTSKKENVQPAKSHVIVPSESTKTNSSRVKQNDSDTPSDYKNSQYETLVTQAQSDKSLEMKKMDRVDPTSKEKVHKVVKTENPIMTESDTINTIQIPPQESDSSGARTWSLNAGLFCNSNWFKQVEDRMYVASIDTKNQFNNRIGLRITVTTPSMKTKLGQVNAAFSYGFIKKEYFLDYELLSPEQEIEYGGYSVITFNHFLSAELNTQIHPKISVGVQYEFIYNSITGSNLARAKTGDDFFASHYILLNLTPVIYQKKNLQVSAFFEYGLPIAQKYFHVHQMNFGLQGRVFKW